jgi:hypothetical protein
MSKIEEYKKAKLVAERAEAQIALALGRDPLADSHELRLLRDSGSCYVIRSGYTVYGKPSYYTAMDETTQSYLVEAINENIERLASRAIEIAKSRAEALRPYAKEEAEAVLRALEEVTC